MEKLIGCLVPTQDEDVSKSLLINFLIDFLTNLPLFFTDFFHFTNMLRVLIIFL